MSKPSTDEIVKRLEMIARLHALTLDIENGETARNARDTWAWKARDRLLELEALVAAKAQQ